MGDQDVVIIGGGIVGVCTAYVLARAGVPATLIESGDLCSGSSYGNAGLICPCHSTPIPGPGVLWQGIRWMADPESPFYIRPRIDFELFDWLWKFRRYCSRKSVDAAVPRLRDLQRASLALYRDWLPALPTDTAFEQRGGLELFLTQRKFDQATAEVAHLRSFGLQMERIDRQAVLQLEPAASENVVGAIHYMEDAHINPAHFVKALAGEAARLGAQICPEEPVLELCLENGRITGVKTGKRTIRASQYVLAAGAWSVPLLRQTGIRLLMQPAKGYSISMAAPPDGPRIPLHLAEARMAVTPMGGLLRFAGTLELSGIDTGINQRRVDAIRRGGRRYLALDSQPEELEIWAGLRPVAPDGLPYIGRHPAADNLVLATGHAMLGVSMGPITGHLTTEILLGRQPSMDISAFKPDRF